MPDREADFKAIIQRLSTSFREKVNPEKAEAMSQYMRNKFPFVGVQKPGRAEITKPFFNELLSIQKELDFSDFIRTLWDKEERDFQYFCMEFLRKAEKYWPEEIIEDFEWMISHKSWWDTVDFIAANLVGKYFVKWPEKKKEFIKKWNETDNMWLNRTAIIFQLTYKEKTDTKLLFNLIEKHKHSKEFFIQKAIGWALRQYAKTDTKAVADFVNKTALKPLSKKEALKHIKAD
jgi:3-methyladenine DNA glycosylase AlkD